MIKILFTKGRNRFSDILCRVTKEDISHVVLQLDDYVIHSNFRGLHIDTLKNFSKTSDILYEIPVPKRFAQKAKEIYDKNAFHGYDLCAFIQIGLRSLGLPLPKANIWKITGMYICTEFVSDVFLGKELLLTPGQLKDRLKGIFQ